MADLATINLALDVVLKIVLLGILIFLAVMLRNIDNLVQKFEKSAESLEHTTETIEDTIRVLRYIPFIGGGGRDE